MNKKIIICLSLIFLISLIFATNDYKEPENSLTVSGIGVDIIDKKYRVIAEITEAGNKGGDEYLVKRVEGIGISFETALTEIENQLIADLTLSHCPIIIFGENTDSKTLYEVTEFCVSNYEIELSVIFTAAENAKEIFTDNDFDKQLGYFMIDLLKSEGFEKNSSLVNYKNEELKKKENFILPYFENINECDPKIGGVAIYKRSGEKIIVNDFTAAQIIKIVNNSYSKSSITVENAVINIKKAKSEIFRSENENAINIKIIATDSFQNKTEVENMFKIYAQKVVDNIFIKYDLCGDEDNFTVNAEFVWEK